MSFLKYTAKAYNEDFYPGYSKAISFLNCIDGALEYCGAEAQRQAKIVGWDEDTKRLLYAALVCYDREVRSNIDIKKWLGV